MTICRHSPNPLWIKREEPNQPDGSISFAISQDQTAFCSTTCQFEMVAVKRKGHPCPDGLTYCLSGHPRL